MFFLFLSEAKKINHKKIYLPEKQTFAKRYGLRLRELLVKNYEADPEFDWDMIISKI